MGGQAASDRDGGLEALASALTHFEAHPVDPVRSRRGGASLASVTGNDRKSDEGEWVAYAPPPLVHRAWRVDQPQRADPGGSLDPAIPHEGDGGVFADVKVAGEWQRVQIDRAEGKRRVIELLKTEHLAKPGE